MAVDSLRETKHINRVTPSGLSTIWTAQSYRPEITSALADIRGSTQWLPLSRICSQPIAQGRTPVYATPGNPGYPCLKTKHINGLITECNDPDFVTPECASSLARFKVAAGTVLMNRSGAGSIGRVSVYLGGELPLTNEHVLHIRISPPHDACFVAAYLSTWWGERAIEQGITGSTGQLNLANEHVSQIPIWAASPDAQRYIGDKVRQAEVFHNASRRLQQASQLLVESLIEGKCSESELVVAQKALEAGNHAPDRALLESLSKSSENTSTASQTRPRAEGVVRSRVSASMLGDRLDAPYYSPAYLANETLLREQGARTLLSCAVRIEAGPFGGNAIADDLYADNGLAFVRPVNISGNSFDTSSLVRVPEERLIAAGLKIYDGDTLFFARVGNPGVAFFSGRASISPNIIAAQLDSTQANSRFVYAQAASRFGLLQLTRGLKTVAQPTTSTDTIREILVLLPDISAQCYIGDKVRQAKTFHSASQNLQQASRLLVESLIEGKLSESDLVAAQKAIDAGDRAPDRAILQSLRRSDAPDAPPLFPDLDALYELLDAPDPEGDR